MPDQTLDAPFRPFETALDEDRALALLREATAGADDGELFLERRRSRKSSPSSAPSVASRSRARARPSSRSVSKGRKGASLGVSGIGLSGLGRARRGAPFRRSPSLVSRD